MVKKTRVEWRSNKEMIHWHLINSVLAGLLVLVGALTDGYLTRIEVIATFGASLIIALTKFREFWDTQKKVYRPALFHFIH